MAQITIGSVTYDVLKMPPRDQQQVLRRILPALTTLGPAIAALLEGESGSDNLIASVVQSIGPLSEVLADMTDERFNYILDKCLLRVNRLDSDIKWHPIYVAQRGEAVRMYQDIDAAAELRLVAEVLKVNLEGFFAQLSGDGAPSLSAV